MPKIPGISGSYVRKQPISQMSLLDSRLRGYWGYRPRCTIQVVVAMPRQGTDCHVAGREESRESDCSHLKTGILPHLGWDVGKARSICAILFGDVTVYFPSVYVMWRVYRAPQDMMAHDLQRTGGGSTVSWGSVPRPACSIMELLRSVNGMRMGEAEQ